jgi:hypothetical protein
MISRIRMLIASLFALAITTVFMAVGATPAAATLQDCPSGHICFWDWINFNNGGAFWSTHIQNAFGGTCVTLPADMRDRTTSLAQNLGGIGDGHLRFYLWVNCNDAGGYLTLSEQFAPQANLNCPTFSSTCTNFYSDNIASFTLFFN